MWCVCVCVSVCVCVCEGIYIYIIILLQIIKGTHQILSKIFKVTHENFCTTSSQTIYELYRVVLVYTVLCGIELGLTVGGGVHLQQLTDGHCCISGWRKRELQF